MADESRDPPLRARINFTDGAGVRWSRDEYGQLSDVLGDPVIRTDRRFMEALSAFADEFRGSYGTRLEFKAARYDEAQKTFTSTSEGLSVEDALFGAHDWIGALVESGTIAPLLLPRGLQSVFPRWALDALSRDGQLYGIPTTLDATALLRNATLVPEIPASFEALLQTGRNLRDVGIVREVLAVRFKKAGDPFQIWPLFSSAGGELFGVDAKDHRHPFTVLIDSPGSVAAFGKLGELGEAGSRVLRRSMNRDEAFSLFAAGKSPFLISTSDALGLRTQCEFPVEVSPVPAFAGSSPSMSLSLINAFFIPRTSVNRRFAEDILVDYLGRAGVVDALAKGLMCPVSTAAPGLLDQGIKAYVDICLAGKLMPAHPRMNEIWHAIGSAQMDAVAGADPGAIAVRCGDEVRRLVG